MFTVYVTLTTLFLPSLLATKTYTYRGHELTQQQYHDRSILLKIDHEANRTDLKHLRDDEITFTDLLAEIKNVKEVHGKVMSPHLVDLTESSHNHRSLLRKNNFIELSVFNDMGCHHKVRSVGRLVNFCYNRYYGSYLYKVNRKQNVIAQIEFEEANCTGVPTKVIDMLSITHAKSQDFAQCVDGVQWNYLSYYPSFKEEGIPGYGSTYVQDHMCDPRVRNYDGYDFHRADHCTKIPHQHNLWMNTNVQGCEVTGQIIQNYFFDGSCSGSIARSVIQSKEICLYPNYWYDEDQNEFKERSSHNVMGRVHTDYCFDPTHASHSPPPVTGTCENGNIYWIGDGYCDPSLNNPGCNYDGGDCCPQTCMGLQFSCGISGYSCADPNAIGGSGGSGGSGM